MGVTNLTLYQSSQYQSIKNLCLQGFVVAEYDYVTNHDKIISIRILLDESALGTSSSQTCKHECNTASFLLLKLPMQSTQVQIQSLKVIDLP